MAGIDHSIYFNQKFANFGDALIDGFKEGQAINKQLTEQREKADYNNAISGGMVQNPDGTYSQNRGLTASGLINAGQGYRLPEIQNQWKAQDDADRKSKFESFVQQQDAQARLLGGAKDQATWTAALQEAPKYGIDVSGLPAAYDQTLRDSLLGRTLTEQQRISNHLEQTKLVQAQKNADRDYALKVAEQKAKKTAPALTEAEAEVDKKFAPEYVKYIKSGRNNAVNTITKLKELAQQVEADSGFGEAGGTRFPIPDMLRSRLAIERRDDARNFANKTLKELFGGQLSDGEREAAAREYWNDSLDNASNAKRLYGKIAELEDNVRAQDAMASYYQKNRTLKGFEYTPTKAETAQTPQSLSQNQSQPQTVTQGGFTYKYNPATGQYE